MRPLLLWTTVYLLFFAYCQHFFAYNYFYVEQFSMFRFSSDYAFPLLLQRNGAVTYVATFLNQYFIHPYAGALITAGLCTLLTAGVYSCGKLLGGRTLLPLLSALPACALLWAGIDFNYHTEGYLSLLLAVGMLNLYLRIDSPRRRLIYMALASWVGYWMAGPHLFVAVAGAAVAEAVRGKGRKPMLQALCLLLWSVLPPLFLHCAYNESLRFLFLPDAYYHPGLGAKVVNYWAGAAVVLGLAVACLPRHGKGEPAKPLWRIAATAVQVVAVAIILHSGTLHYDNPQNSDIQQLDHYCRTAQWEKIVTFPRLRADQNLLHACYQNLALSHLGRLGDRLLHHRQCGVKGLIPHWNQTNMSSTLLSDLYWQTGHIALSQEMAFEGMVSSERAVNPRLLLRLVQTNLLFGHTRVAEKYINLLEQTHGYADRATAYRCFLQQPEAMEQDAELGPKLCCIQSVKGLTNTANSLYDFPMLMYACPSYKPAFHYFGAACLLSKDLKQFAALMTQFGQSPGLAPMPVHFQEALIILHENEPKTWPQHGISQAVIDRFNAFRQDVVRSRQQRNAAQYLQAKYRNTYWYYFMY